jgi:hypothetical protein
MEVALTMTIQYATELMMVVILALSYLKRIQLDLMNPALTSFTLMLEQLS